MGTQMNNNSASKPSAFALKHMQKMGWEEGKGLGKNEDGISKFIHVEKKLDASGVGLDEVVKSEVKENWWHDAYSSNLKLFTSKISGTKKRKKSKISREIDSKNAPSYDDLFAATGGARLGMRARAEQKGKHKRTEIFYNNNVELKIKKTEELNILIDVNDAIEENLKKKLKKENIEKTIESNNDNNEKEKKKKKKNKEKK
jgi:Pin2-interacting protein X1